MLFIINSQHISSADIATLQQAAKQGTTHCVVLTGDSVYHSEFLCNTLPDSFIHVSEEDLMLRGLRIVTTAPHAAKITLISMAKLVALSDTYYPQITL